MRLCQPVHKCACVHVLEGRLWVCKSVCGAFAGGKVAGRRGWPVEAPACVHVAACQPHARAVSVQLSPHECAHACRSLRTSGCSRSLPCLLPVAPSGTQAVPRPLSRVRCCRAPCEGRQAETPLAAGTMRLPAPQETAPRGDRAWGVAVARATLHRDPCVPWGWDMWLCRAAWQCGGALYKCVSPAAANTHPHRPCAILRRGVDPSVQQQRAGRWGHRHWQHPHGALVHAGARARPCETCPCMASLHAVNPRPLGFARVHAPWHVGTGGGWLVHVGVCLSATCMCTWCCAVLVPPGVCMRVCKAWASMCACVCPGSLCPVPRCSMPCSVGCHPPVLPYTWGAHGLPPGNAPSPAPTNPLSPLPPAGCKLSCHTKCQAKVRPAPGGVPVPARGPPGSWRGDATVPAS